MLFNFNVLTPSQKKTTVVSIVLSAIVATLIFGGIDALLGSSELSVLINIGLLFVLVGLTVRFNAKRGWDMYRLTAGNKPSAWPAKTQKLGLFWRGAAAALATRFIIVMLVNFAWSDTSMALLTFIGIGLGFLVATFIGLRFGWNSSEHESHDAVANTQHA